MTGNWPGFAEPCNDIFSVALLEVTDCLGAVQNRKKEIRKERLVLNMRLLNEVVRYPDLSVIRNRIAKRLQCTG